MSEMSERVTKAIFDAMDVTDGIDGSAAERYARAAIEAMREPTPEMLEAGNLPGWDDFVTVGLAAKIWAEMTAAVLHG